MALVGIPDRPAVESDGAGQRLIHMHQRARPGEGDDGAERFNAGANPEPCRYRVSETAEDGSAPELGGVWGRARWAKSRTADAASSERSIAAAPPNTRKETSMPSELEFGLAPRVTRRTRERGTRGG